MLLALRPSLSNFTYWEQKGFLRKFSETITFLYNQAIVDGKTYKMEFAFDTVPQTFAIGEIDTFYTDPDSQQNNFSNSSLTEQREQRQENRFLPTKPQNENEFSLGSTSSIESEIKALRFQGGILVDQMKPIADIPSLREPVELPAGLEYEDVTTLRGKHVTSTTEERPYIIFSPQGYVEFATVHFKLDRADTAYVTVLIDPFTGIPQIFDEYKEFEWTYGGANAANS